MNDTTGYVRVEIDNEVKPMKYRIAMVAIAALALAACTTNASPSPTATPSGAVTAFTGTNWHLRSYNDGKQNVVSVIADTDPTAIFGTDNQVSGNATCNRFFGPYTLTNGTIKIGPLGSTLMACPGTAQQDQETRYLAALQNASSFVIDGLDLRMLDASGALQADLTAIAGESPTGSAEGSGLDSSVATPSPSLSTLSPTAEPSVSAAGEPLDVIRQMIAYVEAGAYDKIPAITCAADKVAAADKYDLSKAMASSLPAGIDPTLLVGAIHMAFADPSFVVVTQTPSDATVVMKGNFTMTFDKAKMTAFVKALLTAEGSPADDATIAASLSMMESSLTNLQAVDSTVHVVNENGKWLICGITDMTAPTPSSSTTP